MVFASRVEHVRRGGRAPAGHEDASVRQCDGDEQVRVGPLQAGPWRVQVLGRGVEELTSRRIARRC